MFDRPQLYNRRTSETVTDGTERLIRQFYPSSAQRPLWNRPVISTTAGVYEAIVTTAITAASSSQYGQGNATIYIDTKSGSTYTYAADPSFAAGLLVLNFYQNSGMISIGTHIMVAFRNGNLRLLTADC